jgi:hypothetical protein
VLDVLVKEKFLCVKPDGTYARLTEGGMWRPRQAKVEPVPEHQPLRQAS